MKEHHCEWFFSHLIKLQFLLISFSEFPMKEHHYEWVFSHLIKLRLFLIYFSDFPMKEYHYNTDMSRRLGDLISLGGAFSTFAQFIHYLHWPAFYFVFNLIFVLFSFVYLQFDLLYNFVLFYALFVFLVFHIFLLSFVCCFIFPFHCLDHQCFLYSSFIPSTISRFTTIPEYDEHGQDDLYC